jgi:Domain of unknown function (DUF4340)
MKTNLKYILVLVGLLIFAGLYYFSNTKGTLNLKKANFSIENPEDVTEIKLIASDVEVLLSRNSDHWELNNNYRARTKTVFEFLRVLSSIDVHSPVSKMEMDQVASILKAEGIIVEVYKGKRVVKRFYVSKPSMSKEKTYMMMTRAGQPYIVRIPLFKGNLADLFTLNENLWRDRTLFDYQAQNIKEITVSYSENPEKSFLATNYGDGTFSLKETNSDSYVENFDVEKLSRYFTYFQNIWFESMATDLKQTETSSVWSSLPFVIIEVEDIKGQVNKLRIYKKTAANEFDEFGKKIEFDFNRAYALFNENNEILIIQYYICDPILKEIDYFR